MAISSCVLQCSNKYYNILNINVCVCNTIILYIINICVIMVMSIM